MNIRELMELFESARRAHEIVRNMQTSHITDNMSTEEIDEATAKAISNDCLSAIGKIVNQPLQDAITIFSSVGQGSMMKKICLEMRVRVYNKVITRLQYSITKTEEQLKEMKNEPGATTNSDENEGTSGNTASSESA